MSRLWLIVSDIDDTLTGSDHDLQHLADRLRPHREAVRFAVNSSRPAASVAETLAEVFPPQLAPDAVITALGTEIAIGGAPLPGWDERFSGWPRAAAYRTLAELGHTPHPHIFQTELKVSFAVARHAQGTARSALTEAGVPCRIIASGADDFDVIPEGAGKAAATEALAAHYGCARDRVVAAGDSGNDVDLFSAAGHGIAVGNARAELLAALAEGTYYHARARHAAGVLEGLVHFGVLPPETDLPPNNQR